MASCGMSSGETAKGFIDATCSATLRANSLNSGVRATKSVAVHLHEDTDAPVEVDVSLDQALMRLPAALLRRNCLPTLSEDATGALYVAIGLLQSPLYVHHPSGRLLAELLYLLDGVSQSSYFSLTHRSLQPHHPPLPDWQRAPPTPRKLRPLPIHRVRAPPGWRGPHWTRVHHRPAHPGGSHRLQAPPRYRQPMPFPLRVRPARQQCLRPQRDRLGH